VASLLRFEGRNENRDRCRRYLRQPQPATVEVIRRITLQAASGTRYADTSSRPIAILCVLIANAFCVR
jgi:hypothetical protein